MAVHLGCLSVAPPGSLSARASAWAFGRRPAARGGAPRGGGARQPYDRGYFGCGTIRM